MSGGPGVVEGAVGGSDRGAKVGSEGPELEAADLAADESSGEPEGVHRLVWQLSVAKAHRGSVEKRHVEANVVSHDYRVSQKLEKRRQRLSDGGSFERHHLGYAGENGDHRWDGDTRVDERLKRSE